MLAQFINLLEGYKGLLTIQVDERLVDYEKLINNFKPFLLEIKEEKKNNAFSYNIFSVLKIEFYEAKVHTPFLANLLDIGGSHCQGDLFYKSFIKQVAPQNKMDLFLSYDPDYLSCILEQRFNNSQPDILIIHKPTDENKRFAIIVENKINAGDQPKQLERYYNDVLKGTEYNFTDEQILIIYLTPNPTEPTETSILEEEKKRLIADNVLICVSYVDDIKDWLLETKKEIKATRLTNILEHYIDLIKTF